MYVILSNTPSALISNLVKKTKIKKWLYLGRDLKVHRKLSHVFLNAGEEVIYSKDLYDISFRHRKNFVQWIDQCSLQSSLNKDWFFSAPAIKNPYTSDLFLKVCYFFVFQHLIKQESDIGFVFVDSPVLVSTLKKYYSNEIRTLNYHFIYELYYKLKLFLRSSLRFFRYFLDFALRIFWARIFLKVYKEWINNPRIVFIRNFITTNYKEKDDPIFENHYFPGLYDYLVGKGFYPIFIPATVQLNIFEYRDIFQKISKSDRNILIPEQMLGLSDFCHALSTPLRGMFFNFPKVSYDQYDFSGLIKEDYFSNLTEFGILYANLLNRLGRRLVQNKIKPMSVVNWNENQSLEKGLLSGLKKYYPDLKIIANQAFIPSSNHLSLIYSQQDKVFDLIPHRLLVLGPQERVLADEFIRLNVNYSPLFRYSNVMQSSQDQPGKKTDLLVVMGFGFNIAVKVIDILINISDKLKPFDKIKIKLHPASYFGLEQIKATLGIAQLPDSFMMLEGDIHQYFHNTSLGICTGGTGVAVELVSKGIPVILVGEERALTLNALSEKKDDSMWRLAFNKQEVLDSINDLIIQEKENINKKSQLYRESFFASPQEKYWENYLS